MPSTISLQQLVDWARAYPKLVPVLGVAGFADEPALTIANQVLAEMFAPPFAWKFNRKAIAPFNSFTFQQDYATSVTDVAWLESATRTEINSTAKPLPIFAVETVRDLQPTSEQGDARSCCWIPNALAVCGGWAPSTTYVAPTSPTTPNAPIPQIRDANGNIQVVKTFGTTGSAQPTWATTAGTTTADGSVVWQMVDPNGTAIRLDRLPGINSVVWQHAPIYQAKAPVLSALSSTFAPVPDELAYVYRQGFLALCYRHAGEPAFPREYALFEAMVQKALGQNDREPDNFQFYPERPLM